MERMDFAAYLELEGANISTLLHLAKSPAHYRHAVETGGKDTPALKLGRLGHTCILEPDRFEAETVVWKGRRQGKAWDEFEAKNTEAGLTIITPGELDQCLGMAVAVAAHPVAGPYLYGQPDPLVEASHRWVHETTGILCKSRFDHVSKAGRRIVDLKTARDASELEFGRAAARLRYHTKAAFYSDAYRDHFGFLPTFVLVVVEKEPPYGVAVYTVGQDAIDAGRIEYRELLGKLKRCRESDSWPGIAQDQETELILPKWAYEQSEAFDLMVGDELVPM